MNDYDILGVAHDATPEQIKAAYRKLAMKHHPDKNGGSPESENKFKEITRAYENLKDGPKNQEETYDPFGGGFNPFADFGFHFQHHGFVRRNADYNVTATITLESAFKGCDITVDMPMEQETIKVELPAGVEDGQRIVIEGRGSKQIKDAAPGNLYVFVRVVPDRRYQRVGANLLMTQEVDLWTMLGGTSIEVTGIDGKEITVEVPANSNPNKGLRVKGEGMTRMDGPRGDLIVQLEVKWPEELSEKQLETIRSLNS